MSMFAIHAIQSESWAYMIKGKVQHEFKFRLENFLAASKMLRRFLEAQNVLDVTDDLGESVSKIFEVLHASKDGRAQKEMLALLAEYASGELKIINEDQIIKSEI